MEELPVAWPGPGKAFEYNEYGRDRRTVRATVRDRADRASNADGNRYERRIAQPNLQTT
jgi:hypothetical protein